MSRRLHTFLASALVGAALSLISGSARAQEAPPPPESILDKLAPFQDVEELDLDDLLDVTVSIATGRAQKPEEAPSIVSVVTAEEIRRSGAKTLAEVLELVPGMEILTDSLGRTQVSMRGVPPTAPGGFDIALLILFNGHRLNEDITGTATNINLDFPVDNIKKVEIIRGPASALYGASAFLGVINIVTQNAEQFTGVEVSAGAGSFATQQYNVLFGDLLGEASLSGFLQLSDTDGPRLPVPADAQTRTDRFLGLLGVPPASLAPGTTRGHRLSLDANFQLAFKGLTLNGRFKDQDSHGYVGLLDVLGRQNRLDGRQIALGASYRRSYGRERTLDARLAYTQNTILSFLDLFPPGFTIPDPDGLVTFPEGVILDSRLNSRRLSGSLAWNQQLFSENQLTVGFDVERESTFDLEARGNFDTVTREPFPSMRPVPSVIPESARTVVGLYLQDAWNVYARLGVTAGLRFDHYDDFGSTVNPRAGLVWRLPHDLDFKLLYGRAFRAPSFTELSVRLPGISGNPALRPTTVNSFEGSLGFRRRNLRISANYYANFLRDTIVREGAFSATSSTTVVNAPGLNVQGLELEAKKTFGLDHSFFVNYSYQRPREANTGERVPKVPSHLANLGVTRGFGRHLSVTPTLRLRASRPRALLDPRPPLPGVALLNVAIRIRNLFETLELSALVDNVLDKKYADPAPSDGLPSDYPRQGRGFFLKATYKF